MYGCTGDKDDDDRGKDIIEDECSTETSFLENILAEATKYHNQRNQKTKIYCG